MSGFLRSARAPRRITVHTLIVDAVGAVMGKCGSAMAIVVPDAQWGWGWGWGAFDRFMRCATALGVDSVCPSKSPTLRRATGPKPG